MSRREIFTVRAPLEGDGPEDLAAWHFATRDEAEAFAYEWGPDGGYTNPWIRPSIEAATVNESHAMRVLAATRKAVGQ